MTDFQNSFTAKPCHWPSIIADGKEYVQMIDKYCSLCIVFFQFFSYTVAFELYIATYPVNILVKMVF